jgi:hypothetical protein
MVQVVDDQSLLILDRPCMPVVIPYRH